MIVKRLLDQFASSSPGAKIAMGATIAVWAIIFVTVLVVGSILLLEGSGEALPPTPGGSTPAIVLEPTAGQVGTSITVRGEGWNPGSMVLIYLVASGEMETPVYGVAGAVADREGRFTTGFVFPAEPRWEGRESATVLARAADSGAAAQALFNIASSPDQPTATPVATSEPTATAEPVATSQPGQPMVTAATHLNIRSGPGTAYSVLGVLGAGQTAQVTGLSADAGWWQIQFSGAADGHGWLSAKYVTAQNTSNVPVVQAPPLPVTPTPTPTPTSTPVVISDWRGEYYNNLSLSGAPVLVRNDVSVNFDWGAGSPAAGVPADNFAARWTRQVDLQSGTYVFSVWVDDGVRLWVDDALLVDSWQDGKSRLIQAERQIGSGKHQVRVEYYERGGGAQIKVTWQRKDQPTNQVPQAAPGGPYTVNEGDLVTFDGRKSKDPDGSIVNYEWDLNYDGRVFIVRATGQTASTGYPDGPAAVTIALRVTDDRGASHIATAQVTVVNVAPAVEAGGPYAGEVGSLISMAGTAIDPGFVDQTGLSYRWDLGDGAQGSGPIVGHSYQQAGSYTVKLTVTDRDGAQATDTATVQVREGNQPPAAVISGPTSGLVGETLSLSGAGSTDSDGRIVRYAWDLGDGTSGGGVNVTHVYGEAGRYTVTLTVTDGGGLDDSAAQTVRIDEPVTNQPPTAVISSPVSGLVGEALSLSGAGSTDGDGRIVSYAWDLGDGAVSSGITVTHSYSATGSYTVTLTVADDGGLDDSATQTVRIDQASL
jgi:PKD repeat protein